MYYILFLSLILPPPPISYFLSGHSLPILILSDPDAITIFKGMRSLFYVLPFSYKATMTKRFLSLNNKERKERKYLQIVTFNFLGVGGGVMRKFKKNYKLFF